MVIDYTLPPETEVECHECLWDGQVGDLTDGFGEKYEDAVTEEDYASRIFCPECLSEDVLEL